MRIGIYIGLLCVSCNMAPTELGDLEKPKDLLSKEVFKKVLYEYYLVEGLYYRNGIKTFHIDSVAERHSIILEKYQVEKEAFQNAYNYYHAFPKEATEMYDEMLEEYQVLKSEIETTEDPVDSEEGLVKDSIHL